MSERIDKCFRLLQCIRQIERANDLIQRTIGWACTKKDFLSQEDQQEIIKNAEDIQMWVGKIMEEVKEQDLKQYADDALKIAGDIVTVYEQERCTKHELHRLSRKQLLLELNRISYIAHKVTTGNEIDSWQAVSEIENIVEQLLELEFDKLSSPPKKCG